MSGMTLVLVMAASFLSMHQQEAPTVSVQEISKKMESGQRVVILDVRTPQEFAGETGHLEGAIPLPVQDLTMRLDELKPFEKDTIVVYCRTDNRSRSAASILVENGFTAVRMKGGITAWRAAELPVVHEVPK